MQAVGGGAEAWQSRRADGDLVLLQLVVDEQKGTVLAREHQHLPREDNHALVRRDTALVHLSNYIYIYIYENKQYISFKKKIKGIEKKQEENGKNFRNH